MTSHAPTKKQVASVLRSKRSERHEDKKRKQQDSEIRKLVREAIKRSKAKNDPSTN